MDRFFDSFPFPSLWQGTVFPWEALSRLPSFLLSMKHKIEIDVPPSVTLEKKELISIGKGTVIEPGVLIQGPCIIGEGCKIRHGAFLRPFVILGAGCSVGHGSEVKHSILFEGAVASHLTYVGDSILGAKVNLGAGVKCANVRFDGRNVSVLWEGKKIGTQLKKMGAIVGDGCQIGCNSVLNPGTLIGKGCFVYPLLNVGGFVAPHSVVKQEKGLHIETLPEIILGKLLK